MTKSVEVRTHLVNVFRRDLVGPGLRDADLARERLTRIPRAGISLDSWPRPTIRLRRMGRSRLRPILLFRRRWKLMSRSRPTMVPGGCRRCGAARDAQHEAALFAVLGRPHGFASARCDGDRGSKFTWGDYRTEPPLSEDLLVPDEYTAKEEDEQPKKKQRPMVDWGRLPQERTVRLQVPNGRGQAVIVPDSAAPQRAGGALRR